MRATELEKAIKFGRVICGNVPDDEKGVLYEQVPDVNSFPY
jgi:hypothetical protein